MNSIIAYAAAGLVAGLGIIWWIVHRMNQAEQADLSNAGFQARNRGEIEADAAETNAERAANEARKRAHEGW